MGFTENQTVVERITAVHPHVCGVYACQSQRQKVQVRFIPTYVGFTGRVFTGRAALRFIPTYVGFTAWSSSAMAFWTVHPHVCGVYECISCKGTGSIGSSPRMWGLPWLRCSSSRSVSVHPHVCGVYAGGRRAQRRCWRFIPTYVGFTGVFDPYIGCVTVHPHVCGVYELQLIKDNRKDGSSPRMWGLLVVPGFHRAFGRFIPTYVGFTTA